MKPKRLSKKEKYILDFLTRLLFLFNVLLCRVSNYHNLTCYKNTADITIIIINKYYRVLDFGLHRKQVIYSILYLEIFWQIGSDTS